MENKKKYTASDLPELLLELDRLRKVEEKLNEVFDLLNAELKTVIRNYLRLREIQKGPLPESMRETMIRLGMEPPSL